MTNEQLKDQLEVNRLERLSLLAELYDNHMDKFDKFFRCDLLALFECKKGYTYERLGGYVDIEFTCAKYQLEGNLEALGYTKTESSPCTSFWVKGDYFISPIGTSSSPTAQQNFMILVGNGYK